MTFHYGSNSIPHAITGTDTGTIVVAADNKRRHLAIYAKTGDIEIAFGAGITFDDVSIVIQEGVMWEPRHPNNGPIWLKGDGSVAVFYLDGEETPI